MYSHCLGTTGFLHRQREQQGHFHPLSLVDWLKLFDNATSAGKPKSAGQYCYYNPVNYQTHLLATIYGPIGRYDVPAYALDRVRQLIQTAFFVGVTEYYATLKKEQCPFMANHTASRTPRQASWPTDPESPPGIFWHWPSLLGVCSGQFWLNLGAWAVFST